MSTTRRVAPRNLPGLKKHFETRIKETEKKLGQLKKQRVKLEKDMLLFQDGVDFCDRLYSRSKRCACHEGSICGSACDRGKHHDGCSQ